MIVSRGFELFTSQMSLNQPTCPLCEALNQQKSIQTRRGNICICVFLQQTNRKDKKKGLFLPSAAVSASDPPGHVCSDKMLRYWIWFAHSMYGSRSHFTHVVTAEGERRSPRCDSAAFCQGSAVWINTQNTDAHSPSHAATLGAGWQNVWLRRRRKAVRFICLLTGRLLHISSVCETDCEKLAAGATSSLLSLSRASRHLHNSSSSTSTAAVNVPLLPKLCIGSALDDVLEHENWENAN